MMELNGTRIPGHQMTVRANFRLEDQDLSGQSSASDTAEQGIKPQTLSVSLIINQDNPAQLTSLISLARAVDEAGKRVVYDIVNDTAAAGNIRKVRFTENFTYSQTETTRAWQVSFTLREYQSVPEKVESRQDQPAATEQTAEGEEVTSTEQTTEAAAPEATPAEGSLEREESGFKTILKKLDKALADEDSQTATG